jgi:hypothetical protein
VIAIIITVFSFSLQFLFLFQTTTFTSKSTKSTTATKSRPRGFAFAIDTLSKSDIRNKKEPTETMKRHPMNAFKQEDQEDKFHNPQNQDGPQKDVVFAEKSICQQLEQIRIQDKPYTRPNLIDTAELAYELTAQDWSEMGTMELSKARSANDEEEEDLKSCNDFKSDNDICSNHSFGLHSIEAFADQMLALLLIRILAILQHRDVNHNVETDDDHDDDIEYEPESASTATKMPRFRDLSTTTICRTILADEAKRTSDETLQNEIEQLTWPDVLTHNVVYQLRSYIHDILSLYKRVFYHNCQHAHHVFLSANKLLDLMLCEFEWESVDKFLKLQEKDNGEKFNGSANTNSIHEETELIVDDYFDQDRQVPTKTKDEEEEEDLEAKIEQLQNILKKDPVREKEIRPTYGIKYNPLIQFGFLFSALVHDVEHKGVSNRQLVLESDELAIMYNDQSVAEQRSLAVAFTILMKPQFVALRGVMFNDRQEFLTFRKDVIALVLCTDISSPERVQIGKSKYKEAFPEKKRNTNIPANCSNVKTNGRKNDGTNETPFSGNTRRHSNSTNHTGEQTDNEEPEVVRERLAKEKKERNAWKSKPADPGFAEPVNKHNLVRKFFNTRGSISTMLPTDSCERQATDNVEVDDCLSEGSHSDDGYSFNSDVSDDLTAYSNMDSVASDQSGLSSSLHDINLARGSRVSNRHTSKTSQGPESRQGRRFSEPHSILNGRRKKFHFRLSIRRALDLTGTVIEAYDKNQKDRLNIPDPDKPNSLKAIVVLEHMLRASDVAALMQNWETMLIWSGNLFEELKVRHSIYL